MATYRVSPAGQVTLTLSAAECKGLRAFAFEGASTLLNDAEWMRVYVGNEQSVAAARRGLDALYSAAAQVGKTTTQPKTE
jgi:hypothetical protein